MKFDASVEHLGVFLIDSASGEVRVANYAEIRPAAIIALLPQELAEGDYKLKVRTLTRGGTALKGVARLGV